MASRRRSIAVGHGNSLGLNSVVVFHWLDMTASEVIFVIGSTNTNDLLPLVLGRPS
ncbi:hypothetical protein CHELA40_40029 [Chelatococcus asaccharovorans]|nr:hypothetical protein CHELA17_50165 [Chelatococcus asaccharovorans]CAH1689417.1 hypothetical protein CHELA40_40029 [Chelatococcus asaccharovorans]